MAGLSNVEKYAIDGMISAGKTLEEIKDELGKTKGSKLVEKYLEEKAVASKNEDDIVKEWENAAKGAISYLIKEGHTNENAEQMVSAALKKIDLGNSVPEVKTIYDNIVSESKSSKFSHKTQFGIRDGVTVMTGAASATGDKPLTPKPNRSTRNSIFNTKTGQYE